MDILGVHYDLIAKTSRMTHAFFRALRINLDQYHPDTFTKRQYSSALGSLVFCNSGHPGSLSMCYSLIRLLRIRRGTPNEWQTIMPVQTLRLLKAVANRYMKLTPTRLQAHSPDLQLVYSDACCSQLGITIPGKGSFYTPLEHSLKIFEAEALALWAAIQQTEGDVLVAIDNQALHYAMRKGRSSTPYVNSLIRAIFGERQSGRKILTKWIPTDSNPADVPSRWVHDVPISHLEVIHWG